MFFYQYKDSKEILINADAASSSLEGVVELQPNTTDAAGEKHVPVITETGERVKVTVGSVEHPMLAAHYIMWIVLETTNGWQKRDLKPGQKPSAVFALTEDEKVVAAYEYCNLHGLWKAEAESLTR